MSTFYKPSIRPDELMHHGIKGQHWGVRHGPPYPIESTVYRKGSKISSVSGDYLDAKSYAKSGRPMYAYNTKDKWDANVYKGAFTTYLRYYRGKDFVKEHQYKVMKDLKMPTKEERVQEFKDLLADPKYRKDAIKTINNTRDQLIKRNAPLSSPDMDERVKNLNLNSKKYDVAAAYEVFNHSMEYAHKYKATTEYMRRMGSKYDAMVDDNNVNYYNNAHDPVIIFKADQVLKPVRSKTVSEIERQRREGNLQRAFNKRGKGEYVKY